MDEARLYTVRVWHHAQQFRAAVRAVGDEHTELFTEPARMLAFLLHDHDADPAPAPPPPAGLADD